MHKQLHLLIVEDSEDDAELIIHEIRRSGYKCVVQRVEEAAAMCTALENHQWNAVISDFNLPRFSALAALQTVQRTDRDIPFIVVSGTVGEDVAVQMLHAGAHDYIMKDNLRRLVPALERSIRDAAVRRERRQAEEVLTSTLEELQKRNYELDNYVYKVSHDLRAPLCSILGLATLARQEDDLGIVKNYVHMIESRVNKLDTFIQSILNHSRMLNAEVAIRPIDVTKLISECLDEFSFLPEWEEMNINVHTTGDKIFYNDEFRVSIVLKNLISNAVKYRNPGASSSQIRFSAAIDGKQAQLTIEDNGIGIDPTYLPQVFDMFFRATSRSDGSGLGLYIVKQTIHQIGGKIWVESSLGEWTRFHITIPNLQSGLLQTPLATNSGTTSLPA
jgi:signal transduction histidine kinase